MQVRLASVRRSLFSSEPERTNFLSRLVNGTRDVLRSQVRGRLHECMGQQCEPQVRLRGWSLRGRACGARIGRDAHFRGALAGLLACRAQPWQALGLHSNYTMRRARCSAPR